MALYDFERSVLELYNKIVQQLTTPNEEGETFLSRAIADGFLEEPEGNSLSNKLAETLDKASVSRANAEPYTKAHNNVTLENLHASQKRGQVEELLFEKARKLLNESLAEGPKEKRNKYTKSQLERLILKERIADAAKGLPDKLYRGTLRQVLRSDGSGGFGDGGVVGPDAQNKPVPYVFVSPEPSVAANYARKDKAAFTEDNVPTNYGDFIYEILTDGLDPSKLVKDDTSYYRELLFGPQYIYQGEIPQEDIWIKDMAGNDRLTPRIKQIPYRSDARLKDVVKPHIVSAVNRKYNG
jgi:hypothetical protein